jgi:branched-chain amino acid transport system ATP-binding protein
MSDDLNRASALAIELRAVHKSFGTTKIINGVSLEIRRGERHAIIGPNGAGKSTLYNLISGRYPVSGGRILLNGEDITGLKPFEVNRKGLSRSFQVTNIFHNLSVYENIRCGELWAAGYKYSFWHRVGGLKDVQRRAEEVMERIGLARRRDVLAGTLTYAEQRALEIGITIAGGSSVILLDEPTSGMSRTETAHAVELVRAVSEGKTLVMVEHDMGVVFDLADRISVLVYGEVLATGTPEEVRANPAVQEAYLGALHKEAARADGSHA